MTSLQHTNCQQTQCTNIRVLVVDDNALNRRIMARIFERAGIFAEVVESGKQALESMQKTPGFDIVLMDMWMPGMTGTEATRHIRDLPGDASNVVIVGLTADTTPETQTACTQAGMNGFFAKPFHNDDLLQTVFAYTCKNSNGP